MSKRKKMKSLEIGNLGEFKFTSSTDLEKTIEMKMFGEEYEVFVFLEYCTSWELSDELIDITIKFMDYLDKNIKKLERKILDYYQNEAKEMAKDQGWIDEYIHIDNAKGLSEVMELSEIQICDFENGEFDIRMIFLCDWDDDEFMILFNKNFEIEEIGSYW